MSPAPIQSDHRRAAGILLHPTSLPGRYGIGDLGHELIAFLNWAASAGMRFWQALPLNPPGYGHSPYGCLSSFAGNPLLIAPQHLLQDDLLPSRGADAVPDFPDDHVAFRDVIPWKMSLLRQSWAHVRDRESIQEAVAAFAAAEQAWLTDFTLYMALKNREGGAPWWRWEKDVARREPQALARMTTELAEEIRFHEFVQFVFFNQWRSVRAAAAARGISIIGDLPIYVACDSADVWSNRELFQLDEEGEPTVVAGVPPDYFSDVGQRWGNPLYRWDLMRESNYRWWVSRIEASLRFADVVRIDHFRGFAAYWEIPVHEPTAVHGRWMPGPGRALFDAVREHLGELPLLAEDLGFITEDVHQLRRTIGIPGMRILQFGFTQADSPHLPHRYEPNTVAYTGTHDNDTAVGWYQSAPEHEQEFARDYLGATKREIPFAMIRSAYTSVARIVIVPAQDVLEIGSEGRMNRPGATEDNWNWRMAPGALTRDAAHKFRRLAEVTGRL
ncbi:MAG TPA: 4-alpha-glucanotransferase [Thermoanaerobaculia bacterium]|nr:4-alpha-glucanotransferase [Thermoanaerobaculia bacterium]